MTNYEIIFLLQGVILGMLFSMILHHLVEPKHKKQKKKTKKNKQKRKKNLYLVMSLVKHILGQRQTNMVN